MCGLGRLLLPGWAHRAVPRPFRGLFHRDGRGRTPEVCFVRGAESGQELLGVGAEEPVLAVPDLDGLALPASGAEVRARALRA